MNKTSIIAFLSGASIGALVAWASVKGIYEKRANEEIDSVKQVFHSQFHKEPVEVKPRKNTPPEMTTKSSLDKTKDLTKASVISSKNGYTNYSDISKNKPQKEETTKGPVVIPSDKFGDEDEYSVISYTYYSDGVLTDENDEQVEDVDARIGVDALSSFGPNDDVIYVRDDRLKVYIEIAKDLRTYASVLEKYPYLKEDG